MIDERSFERPPAGVDWWARKRTRLNVPIQCPAPVTTSQATRVNEVNEVNQSPDYRPADGERGRRKGAKEQRYKKRKTGREQPRKKEEDVTSFA